MFQFGERGTCEILIRVAHSWVLSHDVATLDFARVHGMRYLDYRKTY